MAINYPELSTILNFREKPTSGELALLHFLDDFLDNSYEVFFQPFVNGDRPDIVLLRKNSGAVIIEVKDWDLEHYELDEKKNWILKKNGIIIKSPISQVFSYKENLYNLHITNLLEKRIRNPKLFSVVKCAVYFHQATEDGLKNFLLSGFEHDINYKKFLNHFELWGYDSLTPKKFRNVLSRQWMNKRSRLFDDDLYESFKKHLQPPLHTLEQGKSLRYTSKQRELIKSRPIHQKIKGVVGCGKTYVLAKRAVNAHLRTKRRVLILTYNITLKNYIRDKISEVKEEYSWTNFYITNYHKFITTELNNLGVVIQVPEDLSNKEKSKYFEDSYYSNEEIFAEQSIEINKYPAIFVDEIQDYKSEWIRILRQYFLENNGEFVVFGDEKQNIYARRVDKDKKPITGIVGRWNELNEVFRFTTKIANFALKFQRNFFINKYEVDQIELVQQTSLFDQDEMIRYLFLEPNSNQVYVLESVLEIIKSLNEHPNDICILATNVAILREVDFLIRTRLNQKTTTMFESKEMLQGLESTIKSKKKIDREIENIRQHKKFHFWMNAGTIKLATIHSFKGWEGKTVILIVEKKDINNEFETFELVYAGFTRSRSHLIFINIGNNDYHNFIKKEFRPA